MASTSMRGQANGTKCRDGSLEPENLGKEMRRLRNMWELATTFNFLQVFRPVLRLGLDFSAEELEAGLLNPNNVLKDLHLALMKGIPPVSRNMDRGTWASFLYNKIKDKWFQVSDEELMWRPVKGEEESSYVDLSWPVRVRILKALCEIRLDSDDIKDYIEGSLKTGALDISKLRLESLGVDSSGRKYWYDEGYYLGCRLYTEAPSVLVKGKRGRGMVAPPGEGQWETAAVTFEEFQAVTSALGASRQRADTRVAKILREQILPELEEKERKRERVLKKQQRQALLLMNHMEGYGLAAGRSKRDRKPVNYTFDAYDKVLSAAIGERRKRRGSPSPEPHQHHQQQQNQGMSREERLRLRRGDALPMAETGGAAVGGSGADDDDDDDDDGDEAEHGGSERGWVEAQLDGDKRWRESGREAREAGALREEGSDADASEGEAPRQRGGKGREEAPGEEQEDGKREEEEEEEEEEEDERDSISDGGNWRKSRAKEDDDYIESSSEEEDDDGTDYEGEGNSDEEDWGSRKRRKAKAAKTKRKVTPPGVRRSSRAVNRVSYTRMNGDEDEISDEVGEEGEGEGEGEGARGERTRPARVRKAPERFESSPAREKEDDYGSDGEGYVSNRDDPVGEGNGRDVGVAGVQSGRNDCNDVEGVEFLGRKDLQGGGGNGQDGVYGGRREPWEGEAQYAHNGAYPKDIPIR